MKKILLTCFLFILPISAFADTNDENIQGYSNELSTFYMYYQKYVDEGEKLGDKYSDFLEDELIKITQEYIKIDKEINEIRIGSGFSEYSNTDLDTINNLYAKEYAKNEFEILKISLLRAIDTYYLMGVAENQDSGEIINERDSTLQYPESYSDSSSYPEYEKVNKEIAPFLESKKASLSYGEYMQFLENFSKSLEYRIQQYELLKTTNSEARTKKFKNLRILYIVSSKTIFSEFDGELENLFKTLKEDLSHIEKEVNQNTDDETLREGLTLAITEIETANIYPENSSIYKKIDVFFRDKKSELDDEDYFDYLDLTSKSISEKKELIQNQEPEGLTEIRIKQKRIRILNTILDSEHFNDSRLKTEFESELEGLFELIKETDPNFFEDVSE